VKKELGQIHDFGTANVISSKKSKLLSNNCYIYLSDQNRYGLIKSKIEENLLLLKVRSSNQQK
jgi:hypothetical protein